MGNGQSTASGTKTLAKVARGDARAAQQVRLNGVCHRLLRKQDRARVAPL